MCGLQVKNDNNVIDKSFLDQFWKLSKVNDVSKEEAIINIIEYCSKATAEQQTIYINYTLARLIKGLKTTRTPARIGYSVALVHLLVQFPEKTPTPLLLKEIVQHIVNDKPQSRAESTGQRFGIIFALNVLINSERLNELSDEGLNVLVQSLKELIPLTNYTPSALITLGDLATKVSKETYQSCLSDLVRSQLTDTDEKPFEKESNTILLYLKVKQRHKKSLKGLNIPDYLTTEKLNELLTLMAKGASFSACGIVDFMLHHSDQFKSFWSICLNVVSGSGSSNTKEKSLIIALVSHLLSSGQLTPTLVPVVFAVPFCTFLQRQLSNKQFVLHSACAKLAGLICSFSSLPSTTNKTDTPTDVDKAHTDVASAIFKCLSSTNPLFDQTNCSPHKLLQSLALRTPDTGLLIGYADTLMAAYWSNRSANDTDLDESIDSEEDVKERRNYITLLLRHLVIGTANVPGGIKENVDKRWTKLLENVLFFMMETSIFDKKVTKKSSKASSMPLLTVNRLSLQSALFKCLDVLAVSRRCRGVYADLVSLLLTRACSLLDAGRLHASTEDIDLMKTTMTKAAQDLSNAGEEILTGGKKTAGGALVTSGMFGLLRGHLTLHLLCQLGQGPEGSGDSQAELMDVLTDVQRCQEKAVQSLQPKTPTSHKKRKRSRTDSTGSGTDADDPHWTEVLTDALLNLLSKPCHLLRTTIRLVFGSLVDHLTPACVTLIGDILVAKVTPTRDAEDDEEDLVGFEEDANEEMGEEESEEENEESAKKGKKRRRQMTDTELGDLAVPSEDSADDDEKENDDSSDDEDEDESEEEEDSGSDLDESEDEIPEVELEMLKRRVKSALGSAALDGELEENEEEEEEGVDDATMFRLDSGLAAAFRAIKKRSVKRGQVERKRQLDQLKMRCFDLLEVIVTGTTDMAVLLPCLKTIGDVIAVIDADIQNRALSIVNLLKSRPALTTSTSLDNDIQLLLNALFQIAKKAPPSPQFLSAFASITNFLAKTSAKSKVNSVVQENLKEFFTNRSSHLSKALFVSIFTQTPDLLWSIKDDLFAYAESATIRLYCKTQAFQLLELVAKKSGALELGQAQIHQYAHQIFTRVSKCLDWSSGFQGNPAFVQAAVDLFLWSLVADKSLVNELSQDIKAAFIDLDSKIPPQVRRSTKKVASLITQLSGVSSIDKEQKKREKKEKKRAMKERKKAKQELKDAKRKAKKDAPVPMEVDESSISTPVINGSSENGGPKKKKQKTNA